MHKKLEGELVSLAHSILQMKNRDDVHALHQKAHDIYEKLSVLKFVDRYVSTTPGSDQTKEEIIEKIEDVLFQETSDPDKMTLEIEHLDQVVDHDENEPPEDLIFDDTDEEMEPSPDVQIDVVPDVQNTDQEEVEEEVELTEEADQEEMEEFDLFHIEETPDEEEKIVQMDLSEELEVGLIADQATELFARVTKEEPEIEMKETSNKQRSLNDALFSKHIQVGLNDRIAFVKHLFEGSQEDFNRVLSQLNSFDAEEDAKHFIFKIVKPDYDWSDKIEYEERLIDLIERKFA